MKYLVDTDWVIDHFRGVELITRKKKFIVKKVADGNAPIPVLYPITTPFFYLLLLIS